MSDIDCFDINQFSKASLMKAILSSDVLVFKNIKVKDRKAFIEKCAEFGVLKKDEKYFYKAQHAFTIIPYSNKVDNIVVPIEHYINKSFKIYDETDKVRAIEKAKLQYRMFKASGMWVK